MSNATILLIQALSPIHCGTGASIDAVDLPVARERATGFPYLPGSGIKGAFRDKCRSALPDQVDPVFGPETANASDSAGALVFGDAQLLCLPVRSVRGTFAWVTSPYLLGRFARDLKESGGTLPAIPRPSTVSACEVTASSWLTAQNQRQVVFEDLDFAATQGATALASALAKLVFGTDVDRVAEFQNRFCVVHDDAMSFLAQHATQVVTRVALSPETKTVKNGQLWTEELLPSESILVSLLAPTPGLRSREGVKPLHTLKELTKTTTTLGGKATVGRGRCATRLVGGVP